MKARDRVPHSLAGLCVQLAQPVISLGHNWQEKCENALTWHAEGGQSVGTDGWDQHRTCTLLRTTGTSHSLPLPSSHSPILPL